MTLAMPDSIRVPDLPPGYPAYLGYADGNFRTAPELAARFPNAHRVILTVTGMTVAGADGIDCEPGNPTAWASAEWAVRKLTAEPDFRPVIYASVIGTPGFGMHDVLRELTAHNITRGRVRLLSAHYDWQGTGSDPANRHICGPATCALISTGMDGTQWTDVYPGANHGTVIDMSVLRDDFFTTTQPPQEDYVQFPNIPGTWITATQLIDAHGTEWVTGLGRDGLVYYTRRPAGGTWSAPALVA